MGDIWDGKEDITHEMEDVSHEKASTIRIHRMGFFPRDKALITYIEDIAESRFSHEHSSYL